MDLKNEIDEEIEWRLGELAILRSNHKTSHLSTRRRDVIKKYVIVAIYAIFEGFIVKSFQLYIKAINRLSLTRYDLDKNIVKHCLDMNFCLFRQRVHDNAKLKLVSHLEGFYSKEHIEIPLKIDTGSNVNFKTINTLLNTYGLKSIECKRIEDSLNKLLKYRNSIAHGEIGLQVDDEIIHEFIDSIVNCMDIVRDILIKGFNNNMFLRKE